MDNLKRLLIVVAGLGLVIIIAGYYFSQNIKREKQDVVPEQLPVGEARMIFIPMQSNLSIGQKGRYAINLVSTLPTIDSYKTLVAYEPPIVKFTSTPSKSKITETKPGLLTIEGGQLRLNYEERERYYWATIASFEVEGADQGNVFVEFQEESDVISGGKNILLYSQSTNGIISIK